MYPAKVLSKEAEGSWDGQRVNCNGVGVPTSVRWGWKCCDHYPRARCAFPEKNVSKELPARSERPHHKRHHHFKELVVGKGSHLKGVAPRSHKHTPRVDKSAIQQRPCEESCLQLNPWNMTPSALCKPLPPLCAWPREARTPGGRRQVPQTLLLQWGFPNLRNLGAGVPWSWVPMKRNYTVNDRVWGMHSTGLFHTWKKNYL